MTYTGEEVVVSVQMRDDLISIVELVLSMVTVYVVHWRLEQQDDM